MDTAVRTPARSETGVSELEQLIERLDPTLNRAWVLQRLQEIFVAGRVPNPAPDSFLRGRLVTMSMWGPFDGGVRRLAHLWMPWLGKSFDLETKSGINVMMKGAAAPMKLLWPKHSPRRDLGDRIEAFPFRTWVGAGKVDPDIQVLKIDYDFEANPGFIIRDILDELVQVDDRLFLGKVLLRWRGVHRLVGYFSLAG